MAFQLPSRVLEVTFSTGTGPLTLGGAIDTAHRTFAGPLANGDTTHYFIEGGGHYEIGYGTYSGGVLTRTQVIRSSNSNNAVNWPSGRKLIGVAPIGWTDLDGNNIALLRSLLGMPMAAYTPFVTASSGTFGAAAGYGYYAQLGNMVFVINTVVITTAGTATGAIYCGMPFAVDMSGGWSGQEIAATAVLCGGVIPAFTAQANIARYDGNTIIANGRTVAGGGFFRRT